MLFAGYTATVTTPLIFPLHALLISSRLLHLLQAMATKKCWKTFITLLKKLISLELKTLLNLHSHSKEMS